METTFEYRTLVCVAGACGCEHSHVSDYSWFRPEAARNLVSGAIQHHMALFTAQESQEDKRAWMGTFLCLADAEKQVSR